MQLTTIDHRRFNPADGLDPLFLENLRRVVILAGPNGSGKTRVLNRLLKLNGMASDCCGNHVLAPHFPQSVDGLGYSDRTIQGPLGGGFSINEYTIGVYFSGHKKSPAVFSVVPFVSKRLKLTDPHSQPLNANLKAAETAQKPGAEHLSTCCLAYIEHTQMRWWNAGNPNYKDPSNPKEALDERYRSLQALIHTVLQTELDRNADGKATLYGKPIVDANLSDGQRALLQWCAALHAQNKTLEDIILVMDEPENHLHPQAMIDAVARILDANSHGQVWISTHSVPLLASLFKSHAEEITLYFMDQGRAHYAGRTPEKVLSSLMGGEENVQALREFIDLPAAFASSKFAAECLFSPAVLSGHNHEDPQILVSEKAIFDSGFTTPVKVLDYGAGHGRLLDSLVSGLGEEIKSKLDYVAWDILSKPDERCLDSIHRVYQTKSDRWFNDANTLAAVRPPQSFDVAVMCNVLHEIEPTKWIDSFLAENVLRQFLKKEGQLVIVEDYLMPKGEYAHKYGFVVLDTLAIYALFQSQAGSSGIRVINAEDARYSGRIRAHVVPFHLLSNVTVSSVRNALRQAARNAENQISLIRQNGEVDFRSGQAHAFWVQQFTNATLACKAFGE